MIPVANILYFYSFARNFRLPDSSELFDEGDQIPHLELLARLLAASVSKLLRLNRKDRYVEVSGSGLPLRGRPDLTRPYRLEGSPSFIPYKTRILACPEDEYRFIALATKILINAHSVSARTQQKLRFLSTALPSPTSDSLQLSPRLRPRDQWGRELAWALTVSAVVIRELNLDLLGQRIPFLNFMLARLQEAELFKKYVEGFVARNVGAKFGVSAEKQLNWDACGDHHLVTLIPRQQVDVFADSEPSAWVIEVKSGRSIETNRWGRRRLSSQHLRQLFSYLCLADKFTPQYRDIGGVLVFHDELEMPGEVVFEGYRVLLCPVNLLGDWKAIERRMKWLVARIDPRES